MNVSAQVSLYPLGQLDLAPAIEAVLSVFAEHDLLYEVGPMSTVVSGDDERLFMALREAFAQATELGGAVMTVTISNACPVDPR